MPHSLPGNLSPARLARIRLKVSAITISVIVVYALTLNAFDEDKDPFYDEILAVIDRIPTSDILIIAGDWNARTRRTNTRFRHSRRHLRTWYSNDGVTASQNEHFLVRSRWSDLDSRMFRGAETGSEHGPVHILGRANLHLHLKVVKCRSKPLRYDISKLKSNQIEHLFHIELKNRFNGLQILQSASSDEVWQAVKHNLQSVMSKTHGTTKRKDRDWISG
ncbi:uncharacterized protein LOC115225737 [Octopus sinensis]|uniref:Uncharacterized protein LOC115225737 n=1 Tax=Octopus sinensis TaxID=2607531 RepID=A0A6P7TKT2_9MOLL|nr:uncharacterized protein LOC115225737 [Octopus sinensis]